MQELQPIEIYTSPTCADCKAAKAFLLEKNIPYTEHDVSRSEEAQALKELTGKGIVPTLVIQGKVLYGFANNRQEIEHLLFA